MDATSIATLLDSIEALIVALDREGRIAVFNRACERLTGQSVDALRGEPFWALFQAVEGGEDPRVEFEKLLSDGNPKRFEGVWLDRCGRRRRLSWSLVFTPAQDSMGWCCLATGFDVTERIRRQTELHHAQKLQSVGSLAAGVAHEVNTPIQYVSDTLQFLNDAVEDYRELLSGYRKLCSDETAATIDPARLQELGQLEEDVDLSYLEERVGQAFARAREGIDRVATIVRAMKEFGYPTVKEKQAVDINQAIETTLIVSRNEYKYVAEVECDFGVLPPVICYASDVNQVFLNLIVNAAQAIGGALRTEGAKGRIRVRTYTDKDQAIVEISDTGPGIPEEIRDRVFDPFFTTKEVGRGTGQGLAIARSVVVDMHKGSLTFDCEPDRCTTFRVGLPVDPGS